jgi:hypothetical protein
VDQVQAEWAERIEMDSAVPLRRSTGSVSAVAGKAWNDAKKAAASH